MFSFRSASPLLPRVASAFALVGGLLLAGTASAADPTVHLRGEVVAVRDHQVDVKARNGTVTTVQLPDGYQVMDVSKTSIAAVSENSYLGIAAAPADGGKVRALGVMVFPEGARGLNEGHFPWDLGNKGTMTNATVAKLVKKGSTSELEMRFGDKKQAVLLDNATVFGQFVPGQPALVVSGAKVMVIGQPTDGGPVTARIVLVGRDGFIPPI
ncbi:hypothetical protein [Rhizobacter sp. SG703]|uniref:hypothetical protein n=1 Tax=Rhizobacter sp. SG703 TaxID=2587140 RepID=UPI0014483010|nr:hypothetical protein [Rhizobacter sp. SG703]NKI95729.1 hypothetical protein [Rhizobacter sp. SG703]